MNPLNQWIRLEQMDEENPRFDLFKNLLDIKERSEVEKIASLCAFRIYTNGACVRFDKQISSSQRQGLSVLQFVEINIDVLRFDDWYHTKLNTLFLYELKASISPESICCHCFNDITYNHKHRYLQCSKCDHVKPS